MALSEERELSTLTETVRKKIATDERSDLEAGFPSVYVEVQNARHIVDHVITDTVSI